MPSRRTVPAASRAPGVSGAPGTPGAERAKPAVAPTAPSRALLTFDNPAPQRDYVIRFDVPEFTCLCPLTGQPDFARFVIEMVCDRRCIELKSLKLYFWSYRDEGAFHEKVTNAICDDIVAACAPRFVRVAAHWFVRGGITTYVVAEHRAPGWQPAPAVALAPLGALATTPDVAGRGGAA